MPEGSVECPYHGWRFKRDGQCSKIPSLTGEESLDIEKIKVRSYPVREQDGLIWVYMAAKPGGVPKSEPPRPNLSQPMRWTEIQTFHCGIDHAVIGLMDPSARKCAKSDLVTFAVPITKFLTIIDQMEESFLITDTWTTIQKRIE